MFGKKGLGNFYAWIFAWIWNRKKNDFFKLGGRSEFFGKSLQDQIDKIQSGLKIFKNKEIFVRSFFAPNHTYDENTFQALKECKINIVIDGYGIEPYKENQLIFIPQLFYRLLSLPFTFQTTQLHINSWNEEDFGFFEEYIANNKDKIITFDKILEKISENSFKKYINKFIKYVLTFTIVKRKINLVGMIRIELMTSSMSTKRSTTELHALRYFY